jgi:hypothetical protein
MVLESAEILVKPGMEEAFEAGVREAAPLFTRAYRLLVQWDTLEDHTVHFRGSEDFQEWRRLVGACFDGAPNVTHLSGVLDAF